MKLRVQLLVFISSLGALFAQEFNTYSAQHIYQSSYVNPAAIPDQKVSFSLLTGSTYLSLVHPVTIKDISSDEKGRVTQTSLKNAFQNSTNLLEFNFGYELFHLRFKVRNTYLSFDANNRMHSRLFLPNDIAKLLDGNVDKNGNGSTFDFSKFGFEYMHYNQYAFGVTQELKRLNFGVRAKFLQGLSHAGVDATNTKIDFSDPRNMYDMRVTANGTYRSSGTSNFNQNYFTNFQNVGFGMDLGVTYKVTKNFQINASINNLGFITWRNDVRQTDLSTGTISFTGIDIGRDLFAGKTNAGQNFGDSLSNSVDIRSANNQSYTTIMNPQYYLSGRYYITPRVDMWLTLYGMYFKDLFFGGSLGAQVKLTRVFSIMGSASLMYKTPYFGTGIVLKLAAFQMYGMLDNVYFEGATVPISNSGFSTDMVALPVNTRLVNARFGLNYVFGRNALMQKQPFDKEQ